MKRKPILTPDLHGIDLVFYNPIVDFNHDENQVFISNLDLEEVMEELESDKDYYIVLYRDDVIELACLRNCRVGYVDDETLGIMYYDRFNVTLDEESEEYKKHDTQYSIYKELEPIIRKVKIDSLLD
jgi:hypothetical protein